MLARLWWKEARIFGPVWVILLLGAAGLQWFLVSVNSEDVRSGALTFVNLIWALLYACAAASAAFAGERESNTLGFLDALPVRRRTLWLGKVTFVFLSTIGLSLALVALAELGTDLRSSNGYYRFSSVVPIFGVLLFESVAWGLFWSSVSKNPLLAGAMTVVSVASSSMMAAWLINQVVEQVGPSIFDFGIVAIGMILAILALSASAVVMTWRPSRGWSTRTRSDSWLRVPILLPLPSTGGRLGWQAWREGWSTGLFAGLVGLFLPILLHVLGTPIDGLMGLCAIAVACLVAGVSVFGMDHASKGRRFLVNHGVRSGVVWWWKFVAWSTGIGAFFGLMVFTILLFESELKSSDLTSIGPPGSAISLLGATVANAFAVGIVCGMAIRRRITAVLVGIMVLIGLLPLQLGLVWQGMIPSWSWLLIPLILLGISRAWANDWLLESEGPRPWFRLGALILVPFAILGTSYASYRALSVRDIGPQFDPTVVQTPALPPDQDAVEVYRQAVSRVRADANFYTDKNGTTSVRLDQMIADGWDPKQEQVVGFWKNNLETIELARKASTRPQAVFEPNLATMSIASNHSGLLRGLWMLGQLLALDARERLSRGDLPGAWEDLLAQFRISVQLGKSSPTMMQMRTACLFHQQAVALSFDWLGDARQTPETIRRALNDLKTLPTLPNLVETLQVESSIMERSFDLSANEIADVLVNSTLRSRPIVELVVFTKLVAAPWERLRARRVCRILIADEITTAKLEPWQGRRLVDWRGLTRAEFQDSALTRMIFPGFETLLLRLDNELVGRRALDQAVALVAWKLDHGGEYPSKLTEIGPGLLTHLPIDPYSGRPFGYVRSPGQTILPLLGTTPHTIKAGQPLLYSVGPDRSDDGGKLSYGSSQAVASDLIFAVP